MTCCDGGWCPNDARPIPSLGEITIATNQTGETVAGSLRVLSPSRMNGFLRYSLYANQGISGAGVPSSFATHNFISPVQRKKAGVNTGLAIHNLGDEAVNVRCELMKDGMELERAEFELPANGQSAQFITELFPDFFAEPEPEEQPAASENGDESCRFKNGGIQAPKNRTATCSEVR